MLATCDTFRKAVKTVRYLNSKLFTEIDYSAFNDFVSIMARNFAIESNENDVVGQNDVKTVIKVIRADAGTSLAFKK